MRRDLGDFQTPPALVADVLRVLGCTGERWPRILEPTCGCGNFIAGLLALSPPPREIQGIELQSAYIEAAGALAQNSPACRVSLKKANLFDINLRRDLDWQTTGPLLVVGNPPWVTNSELGVLGSGNLPHKRNLKGLPGIEAITGAANFDIAEYIWIKIIRELAQEHPTVAMLSKTSVARNLFQFARHCDLPISHATIRRIDAAKWFGAAVDACLFTMELGDGCPRYEAEVYDTLQAREPCSHIGWARGHLVANTDRYQRARFVDGTSPVTWRQGLKHDAAPVLELVCDGTGNLRNKLGENVVVESDHLYPLLKGSDLIHQETPRPSRQVIVTQTKLGEDTRRLRQDAPRLWDYLTLHQDVFEARKSSIYRNQPPFAIFGIGEYSFAPYKVAISGLHKQPRFCVIGPVDGQPVMLDDTCYLVGCHSIEKAALVAALLNDPLCLEFIQSLAFWDAKRPITKKLLQRIDLIALLAHVDRDVVLARADCYARVSRPLATGLSVEWPPSLEELVSDSGAESRPTSQATFEWAGRPAQTRS